MSETHIDPVQYAATMKKIRQRRTYLFAVVAAYIPALVVTHAISPTNRAMGTVFAIWLLFLIPCIFLVAISRCPRCGNYFHIHGPTFIILRKCLHCQLHIGADTLPEP